MKLKVLLLLMIVIAAVSSCKKESLEQRNEREAYQWDWLSSLLVDTSDADAYFFIGHSSYRNASNEFTGDGFGISGTVFANTSSFACTNRVYGGLLTVHDQIIYGDSTSSCPSYLAPTTGQQEPVSLSGVFGSRVLFKLNGSQNFPMLQDSVDLPEKIYISSTAPAWNTSGLGMFPSVSKSGGFTLQWNADPGNQYGQVGVMLSVSQLYTEMNDSTLNIPANSSVYSFTTDDDGSYTFDSTDFAQFPVNAVLHIFIGRVCANDVSDGTKTISVIGKTDSWITVALKP